MHELEVSTLSSESERALLEKFAQAMRKRLRIRVSLHEDKVLFETPDYLARRNDDKEVSAALTLGRTELIERLEPMTRAELWCDGFFSAIDGVFEHPVRFTGDLMHRWMRGERGFECQARGLPVAMCIAEASPECAMSSLMQEREMPRLFSRHYSSMLESMSIDELMGSTGLAVLRIETSIDLDVATLKGLARDYLLNIAMARGVSLELCSADSRQRRIVSRGASGQYSLFPYREYDEQVSRYYHQAIVANELPFAQYLAFYQVIEYYYGKELKDAVMAILEDVTTSVYPTKGVLENCYKRITVEFEGENARGRELTDLKRCIQRQVDLSTLKDRLEELDQDAATYYSKHNVAFVKQEKYPESEKPLKLKLTDDQGDTKAVLETIAERIYSVRCAIVHSKSDVASNYQPFLHDDDLAKEVPLVQAVAEQMLLGASPMRELKVET